MQAELFVSEKYATQDKQNRNDIIPYDIKILMQGSLFVGTKYSSQDKQ